eukprot:scaffold306886_cov30-Tisochrysis_lutea.AAC.4
MQCAPSDVALTQLSLSGAWQRYCGCSRPQLQRWRKERFFSAETTQRLVAVRPEVQGWQSCSVRSKPPVRASHSSATPLSDEATSRAPAPSSIAPLPTSLPEIGTLEDRC